MSRKYVPTDSDRATVETMAAAGMNHETIARCLGDDGIDEKTMRKHFRRELDVSAAKSNALAASQVFKAVQRGEAWACCFWLKCRANWKERQAIEHTGAEGAPLISDAQVRKLLEENAPPDGG